METTLGLMLPLVFMGFLLLFSLTYDKVKKWAWEERDEQNRAR